MKKSENESSLKRRKLLIVMPSLVGGGAERVLINLLKLIDINKYEVDLFVVEHKGELWPQVPKEVNKYLIFPSVILSKLSSYLYRRFGVNLLIKLHGKKIKGNYDVGISFLDSIHTEFLFHNDAKINKRVTVIHSSYKSYSNKSRFIKGKYKKVIKKRLKQLDTIISVSHEGLLEFKEMLGEYKDMRVIYNPINARDIIKKSSSNIPIKVEGEILNFIAIGSLIPVKGFDMLISAAKILKDKGFKFRINILGEGFLRKELESQIQLSELNDCVFLKGFIPNPYPWLLHSDVLVMSSESEGLPTVLCEALILGKPTITPNVPGCREVVDYGNSGLMFDRNASQLASAMQVFIEDKSKMAYYAEKSKERSIIFNDKSAVEQYMQVFDQD
ncbi:glycosyltransferase [Mangrovimonas aestuarii]|uniref:glycosyltransferase n=1 Tax=Mangrovimonas aestuarii TaxID=3018443 RepID=UPI0023798716|nr:glycosyltransferase [Mangrovimonas aestuarii]